MEVTYQIDDRFCPKGHKWIRHNASLLFSDCYYCKDCDKIFIPTVKELTKEWFEKNYNSRRFEEIKQDCFRSEAMNKVTKDDLVKLGYLKRVGKN
jgi:hypothetical protein